jgi:hypothetical protein
VFLLEKITRKTNIVRKKFTVSNGDAVIFGATLAARVNHGQIAPAFIIRIIKWI